MKFAILWEINGEQVDKVYIYEPDPAKTYKENMNLYDKMICDETDKGISQGWAFLRCHIV